MLKIRSDLPIPIHVGIQVNNNIGALNAHHAATRQNAAVARAVERLSSGLRVNRAADDAASLAISQALSTQVRGGQQASKNLQDGISMLRTADGACDVVAPMVQRIRELALQAANGTYTDAQRGLMDAEVQALLSEITRTAGATEFNTIKLFAGTGTIITTSPLRATSATGPTQNFSVNTRNTLATAALPVVAGNTVATLTGPAEVYGLGGVGPQSIVVTLRDTGLGTSRIVPPSDFTYNAGTNQVTLTGAGNPIAGENQLIVDFVPQGSLTRTLASTPEAGSEIISLNGVPVPAGGANGYSLAGNVVTINGNARPTAANPTTLQAAYTPAGTTTLAVDVSNPFFTGAILNQPTLTFTVNGVAQTWTNGVEYTINQSLADTAGSTQLYTYNLVVDNAAVAAAAPGAATLQASYTVDYPQAIGPTLIDLQVGANQTNVITVSIGQISAGALGFSATTTIGTAADAITTIAECDAALNVLNGVRAGIGAQENRLVSAYDDLTTGVINQDKARSQILDADFAEEATTRSRRQILADSAQSTLKTAQQQPSLLTRLFQGL